MTEPAPVTYRDAGVDIDAGDELVERIKPRVKRSMRSEVLGGIGGFGAWSKYPWTAIKKPVLVSGTDGVGTKLRLAIDTGGMTASASTWSPCAPMTWSSKAPNRCSFWTTTPPASSWWISASGSSPASSRAACKPAAPWSAARPPKCPACITARTTTSRDFASVWSTRTPSSTALQDARRRCGAGPALLRVRIPTAFP
jgi:hypothetical protein